ncbi:MAG: hypothetical protein NVSMB19_00770 [Vulcanimicrobiaceae bacterium]
MPERAAGTHVLARVRAATLGLFVVLALTGCRGPGRSELARSADRADHTGLFTWLVEHEPSALVAWRVSTARLRRIVPGAQIQSARGPRPCAQAARAHAALVLVADARAGRERAAALDCGVALYRDGGGLVIAPR